LITSVVITQQATIRGLSAP